jgi:hypothetical protein
MKFTNYIWQLYKNTDQAKYWIELFREENIEKAADQFNFDTSADLIQDGNDFVLNCQEWIKELKKEEINNNEDAKDFFEILIKSFTTESGKGNSLFLEIIELLTTALYHAFPKHFLPYYFDRVNYAQLLALCADYEVSLPPNPPRYNSTQRAWYYFELCQSLHRFREKHNIPESEFPAFLYDFGLKSLEQVQELELPKPSRAYFLGAGAGDKGDFTLLDNADSTTFSGWGAGGLKIHKGDLAVIYCVTPRSYIHSIWRAIDDSFINPFQYWFYEVKIGFPHKIKPVTLKEMKVNPILSQNVAVRSNMQGMNGKVLSAAEYAELLRLIESKEVSVSKLPHLPVYERAVDDIENERDVEEQLIEPLLRDLNFNENDWIRQLPISMGRGIRYYSDYAIIVNTTRGKETAKIILEAKYSITTDKQLEEAFYQALSYARRLQSEIIIIADRDFVWVYNRDKNDFDSSHCLKFHWNDLENSDKLYQLKSLIK